MMSKLIKIKLSNSKDLLEFIIWADFKKMPYLYADKSISLLRFSGILKQAFINNEKELFLIYNKRGIGIDYPCRNKNYKSITIPYKYLNKIYGIDKKVNYLSQEENKYFNFLIHN